MLEHGQFIMGPEIGELEGRLAEFVGVKYCVSVSSGTDALLIALMAAGVRCDDEIITTPLSFVAAAEVIALLGARPIFVDVDAATCNIDPDRIDAAVTPRTKAIVAVDLYGQCADYDRINAIAQRHGLLVIEDAAQSFGATYKGRMAGSLATIGCTSFFPSKPLGCYGDGGACFTADAMLAERMKRIRVHGQDRRYHHTDIGINGRLDTLQAAILLAKLDFFPDEVAARQRIGARYAERLPQYVLLPVAPYNTSVYGQYTIRLKSRDRAAKALQEAGIPFAIHYPTTLNRQPAFEYLAQPPGAFPVAEAAADEVLSLPMHPYLSSQDQDRVIRIINEIAVGAV